MTGPLASLKIVEFTGLGPAPLAGQLLSDLSAQVVVIDRKSAAADKADVNRRGKRSVALNLKSAAGREAALKLIAASDVVIEGFRPGVMEKLGLGPQDCPDHIIYARMTGWGQTGPASMTAGHDLTYLAPTGPKNGPPMPPLNLVADFGGGTMFLIMGILSAVIERGVSGKGQVVDAAMIDGAPALAGMIFGWLSQGAWQEARQSNLLDGGAPFYRCYTCADGKAVAFGALEPQFFAEFVDIAGLPDGDKAAQYERSQWADMHARYEALFLTKTRDEWAAMFAETDACLAPVLTVAEAAARPHNVARDLYAQVDGIWHPQVAPRFDRSVAARTAKVHGAGADSEAVLAELGYDAATLVALRKDGTLT